MAKQYEKLKALVETNAHMNGQEKSDLKAWLFDRQAHECPAYIQIDNTDTADLAMNLIEALKYEDQGVIDRLCTAIAGRHASDVLMIVGS